MTKPKHIRYLEQFSDRIENLDLDPGAVIGCVGEDRKSIHLHLVEDSKGASELLSVSPFYVELKLGYGNPAVVDSVFLIRGHGSAVVPNQPMYLVSGGSDLHNYGSVISGMNLPEGSIVPLTKPRTLGSIVRKLENCGLNGKRS